MKIRDLGKAILDFELSNIPKVIHMVASVILSLLYTVFCWVIRTYKSLWGFILLACIFIFFHGFEKNCTEYCWRVIDLYKGYTIKEANLYIIVALLAGLIASFKIDKKLRSINFKSIN